jgi:3alpha(or 20beta)-hydroxysteroid dehydrogenase
MQEPFITMENEVVLITGAAKGQGAEEAELLASLGATVVLTDFDVAAGEERARIIGGDASFATLDVSDGDAWARVVADVVKAHGRVDVLVNNAGIWRADPLESWTDADLRRLLEVNLLGPILGMRTVVGAMPETGGSIVNIASTAGIGGIRNAVAYSSAKFGLRGATRSAAIEFGARGIRVNCVCPGAVDTTMIDAAHQDFSHIPLQRAGRVDEVAKLVAYLASDASSYCTGAEFVIDGGSKA